LILRKAMKESVVPTNAKVQTRAVYELHFDILECEDIKYSIIK
jgi:hypothetical protein